MRKSVPDPLSRKPCAYLGLCRAMSLSLCIAFGIGVSAVLPAAAEPARIGVSLPLTGPLAEYGVAVRNGIELAKSDFPELTSNLAFIFEDDRYEARTALTIFQKLTTIDGVRLVLSWGNETALAVAPVAEQRKIPMIAVAQHPRVGAGQKYVIRFINPTRDYSEALAGYLKSRGQKRLAVVTAELSFFDALLDDLATAYKGSGEVDIRQRVLPSQADFGTIVAKLKTEKPDALGLYLMPSQLVQFGLQAKLQGLVVPIFGATPFESKTVIDRALGSLEGAVYTQVVTDEAFRKRYLERFGNDVEIAYAANAYEFVILTAEIFQSHSGGSAEQLLAAYASIPPRQGKAAGQFHFVPEAGAGGYFKFKVVVKTIRGGQIVQLDTVS